MYGYYPKPSKCVLVVKNDEIKQRAEEMFGKYGMEITTSSKSHLGAIIGISEYKEEFVNSKVEEWINDVKKLSTIAKSEPQVSYSAMVFGIQHRWKFVQRTISNISELLLPLENEIRHNLIPALVGREVSDDERDILALPKFDTVVLEYPGQMKTVILNMLHLVKSHST